MRIYLRRKNLYVLHAFVVQIVAVRELRPAVLEVVAVVKEALQMMEAVVAAAVLSVTTTQGQIAPLSFAAGSLEAMIQL